MTDEYKEMVCRVRFIDGVPAKTYLSDVEIVRCKDCKHQRKEKHPRAGVDHWTYWCDMDAEGLGMDNDFCSMAERIDDDGRSGQN